MEIVSKRREVATLCFYIFLWPSCVRRVENVINCFWYTMHYWLNSTTVSIFRQVFGHSRAAGYWMGYKTFVKKNWQCFLEFWLDYYKQYCKTILLGLFYQKIVYLFSKAFNSLWYSAKLFTLHALIITKWEMWLINKVIHNYLLLRLKSHIIVQFMVPVPSSIALSYWYFNLETKLACSFLKMMKVSSFCCTYLNVITPCNVFWMTPFCHSILQRRWISI